MLQSCPLPPPPPNSPAIVDILNQTTVSTLKSPAKKDTPTQASVPPPPPDTQLSQRLQPKLQSPLPNSPGKVDVYDPCSREKLRQTL